MELDEPVRSTRTPRADRTKRGFVREVVRGLYTHHAFDHAATMAFYFFLGLVPLLVFAGLLLGKVVERAGVDALVGPLYQFVPHATGDLLRGELRDIADAPSGSLAPLSLLGFLWLTSNGFHNLMDVFELLLGVPPRSWWRQRTIALGWVAVTLVSLLLATGLVLVLNGLFTGIEDVTRSFSRLLRRERALLATGWQSVVLVLVGIVLCIGGLAAFYRVAVAYPKGTRRHIWPGALLAVALWVIVTWLFGNYVQTIGHYTVYYGSVAAVAVTLLWLYLTSLALLVGAEVNARLDADTFGSL